MRTNGGMNPDVGQFTHTDSSITREGEPNSVSPRNPHRCGRFRVGYTHVYAFHGVPVYLACENAAKKFMAPSRGEAAAKHTAAQIPARPLQCGERIVADISPYYHHSVDQRDGAGSGDWLPHAGHPERHQARECCRMEFAARNLLQPARADLMLVISQVWLDQMQSNRSATFDADRANLLNKAKFVVGVHEYDHWDEALDEMEREGRSAHVGEEALPSWRIRLRALDCPNRGEALGGLVAGPTVQCRDMLALRSGSRFQGSAAIVGFYRWRAKRALQERRLIERYDAFVYTRVDIFFLCVATALPYWSSSAAPSGGGDGHRALR